MRVHPFQIPEGRKSGHDNNRFKWRKIKKLADEKLVSAARVVEGGDDSRRRKGGARSLPVLVKDTHVEVKQGEDEVDFQQVS